MKQAILGFLAGAAITAVTLTWFGYAHFIIRTPEGVRVISKTSGNFQRLYVDVRDWGTLDYLRNRDVTEALAGEGRAKAKDAMGSAVDKAKQELEAAKEQLQKQLQR